MSKKILLGVSGGIAAYKACELVRALKKEGHQVRVVMTEGAQEFVRPLTFQVLSENPVGVTTFDPQYEGEIGHIDLARWAQVVVVAPATANTIARMAQGLADDLLSTVLLATTAPVVVAPAMNTQMWLHPRVQANLEILQASPGVFVVEPDQGELACKEVGKGRLPDAEVLIQEIDRVLAEPILEGRRVLVTAGPTREFIDPARFLSNPSSGRMGHCLAKVAWEMGADVTLVRGPVGLNAPVGVDVVEVTTARSMHRAVMSRVEEMDVVVKVAAVADFRPAEESPVKLKKGAIEESLKLEKNPDILAELGARFGPNGDESGPLIVGFAAESDRVIERARGKLEHKGAHMMIANQIGGPNSTFGAKRASVTLISDQGILEIGERAKVELARAIWTELAARI